MENERFETGNREVESCEIERLETGNERMETQNRGLRPGPVWEKRSKNNRYRLETKR